MAYASTIAVDLVTRHHNLSDDSFERIYRVTQAIAGPGGDASDFTVEIASISNPFDGDQDNSDIEIDWVETSRGQPQLKEEHLPHLDLPDIVPGDSVIVVWVSGSYTLPFVPANIASLDFHHQSVRRPRFVNQVPINDA